MPKKKSKSMSSSKSGKHTNIRNTDTGHYFSQWYDGNPIWRKDKNLARKYRDGNHRDDYSKLTKYGQKNKKGYKLKHG